MHFSCIIVDEVYCVLMAEIFTIVSYRGEGFPNFNNKLLTSYEYLHHWYFFNNNDNMSYKPS